MTNQWIEQAIDEARAEHDRLLDSIRPILQDVRRIGDAIEALTGEPQETPHLLDLLGVTEPPELPDTGQQAPVEEPTAERQGANEPKATPPHKSKRTGGAIDFGGPELLPEHLRLLPSATKSMAVEKRIVAAEKEETALRLLEQAGPGGLLSNVLASKLGDRTNKTHLSDVGRRLRALNDGGFVEELGTGFAPWQDPARKAGKGGGRPAIRYGITRKGLKALGEPVEDDDDLSEHSTATTAPLRSPDPSRPSDGTHVPENAEPRLELVRDKATLMTSPFTAAELLVEQDLDWDMRVTMMRLAQLAQQRILDSREELRGTTYGYERPTSPGKAAELTQAQRREREREGVATPVPGTGTRGLFTGNAKVNKLLRAVSRQGGTYRRTGGDHWLVEYNGGRRTIAGTPNEAGLKKDIAKLRRLGLAV